MCYRLYCIFWIPIWYSSINPPARIVHTLISFYFCGERVTKQKTENHWLAWVYLPIDRLLRKREICLSSCHLLCNSRVSWFLGKRGKTSYQVGRSVLLTASIMRVLRNCYSNSVWNENIFSVKVRTHLWILHQAISALWQMENLTKLISEYNGLTSVVDWLERVELICDLLGVEQVIPLQLVGGVFDIYLQLSDVAWVKEALWKAFVGSI